MGKPSNHLNQKETLTPADPPPDAAEERARAVTRLFQEHNRALISFVQLRLHNAHEAREVAQEAYVRLLELDRTGAVSFLQAYLFKIAANLAVDRVRRGLVQRRRIAEEEHFVDEIDEAAAPERILVAKQELDEICAELDTLAPRCAQAFVMHAVLERPAMEIAAELGVSDRMVRYYIGQGYAKCQEVRRRNKQRSEGQDR